VVHKNVPFVVILIKALEAYKVQNEGKTPVMEAEKDQLR